MRRQWGDAASIVRSTTIDALIATGIHHDGLHRLGFSLPMLVDGMKATTTHITTLGYGRL